MIYTTKPEAMSDEERGALRFEEAWKKCKRLGLSHQAAWEGVYHEHLAMAAEERANATKPAPGDDALAEALEEAHLSVHAGIRIPPGQRTPQGKRNRLAFLAKARELLCQRPTPADVESLTKLIEELRLRVPFATTSSAQIAEAVLAHVWTTKPDAADVESLAKLLRLKFGWAFTWEGIAQEALSHVGLELANCRRRELEEARAAIGDEVRMRDEEIAALKADLAEAEKMIANAAESNQRHVEEKLDLNKQLAAARQAEAKARHDGIMAARAAVVKRRDGLQEGDSRTGWYMLNLVVGDLYVMAKEACASQPAPAKAELGLPGVGEPIEFWMMGDWHRTEVDAVNEALGECGTKLGPTIRLEGEGKYWRRVQPAASPDKPAPASEPRCKSCGGPAHEPHSPEAVIGATCIAGEIEEVTCGDGNPAAEQAPAEPPAPKLRRLRRLDTHGGWIPQEDAAKAASADFADELAAALDQQWRKLAEQDRLDSITLCERHLASLGQAMRELADRDKRIAELESWKASAMSVLNEWEKVAEATKDGAKLGASKAANAMAFVQRLQSQLAEARKPLTRNEIVSLTASWADKGISLSLHDAMEASAKAQREKGSR